MRVVCFGRLSGKKACLFCHCDYSSQFFELLLPCMVVTNVDASDIFALKIHLACTPFKPVLSDKLINVSGSPCN